ncbi:vesicular glutamate transporter 1 isoform X2 [Nematostella vectensis]|nr:vesicular glutamate transporter 1 isoform X2 [Nematostella vectensis]
MLEGLVLGVMFPCNHAIWSKWAPAMERATLLTISIAGCTVGSVATMPITGMLTKYGFDGGWASVFYCFGAFGVLWYIMWVLLAYETPSFHPSISDEEREFIEETAVHASELSGGVPWKEILGSKRVWGIAVGAFAGDWGLYVLLICVPLYLLDVIHYDVHHMGFVAATPFLLKAISCPVGGCVADMLRRRGYLRTISVRRLFYCAGATAGMFIVLSGYIAHPVYVVIVVGLAGLMSGLIYPGFQVNMLDIAPRNSSIIMGLCNTIGGTTGFITPMMVGFMTRNKTAEEWRLVFWTTLLVYIIGATVFCLLVSVDRQQWDKPKEPNTQTPVKRGLEEVSNDSIELSEDAELNKKQ